jgi:hypothetical protein
MGSKNRQPAKSKPPIADNVSQPPFETAELREGIRRLLDEKFEDSKTGTLRRIGSFKFGVYAFYDYDGEPIYVGQTRESLSTRVRRHLTNQRTDAVAMSVLDPFEVCEVQLWPLPELDGLGKNDAKVRQRLDGLESTIYEALLKESQFKAVLNEKIPLYSKPGKIPTSFRARIVSDEVMKVRSHPDLRLARRAATISRLAQIVSERKVAVGLRRVLVVQAERLFSLADRRFKHFAADPESDDEDDSDEE